MAYLPALRQVGGLILIVMGLNLAGILTLGPAPAQLAAAPGRWRLVAGHLGRGNVIGGTFGPAGSDGRPGPASTSLGDRIGARLTGSDHAWLATFGLGVIFAIGWTPCIGTILGGILTLAATSDGVLRGGILLVGYTARAGHPVPRPGRPLRPRAARSSGRSSATAGRSPWSAACSSPAIGLAMLFDLLIIVPRYLTFLTAI